MVGNGNLLRKVAQDTRSMLDYRNTIQIVNVNNFALTMKLLTMYTAPYKYDIHVQLNSSRMPPHLNPCANLKPSMNGSWNISNIGKHVIIRKYFWNLWFTIIFENFAIQKLLCIQYYKAIQVSQTTRISFLMDSYIIFLSNFPAILCIIAIASYIAIWSQHFWIKPLSS